MKKRLVGAIVLVALGVIFIPALLDNTGQQEQFTVKMEIPSKPEIKLPEKLNELQEEQANLQGESITPPEPVPDSVPEHIAVKNAVLSSGNEKRPKKLIHEKPLPEFKKTDLNKPDQPLSKQVQKTWVVQVGSFSQEPNASGLRDSLLRLGQKAFVEKTSGATGTIYRVRIGPVEDRDTAERLRDQLSKLGQRNLIVMPYP